MKSVPLLDVAPLSADRVRPYAGRRPYLATGGVDDEADLTPTEVTYADRPTRADLCVQSGDVSFARMQGTKKILEFNAEHIDLILSTGFAVLRPDSTRLHTGYLRHWLSTDAFQFAKDRLCSGATQKAITNEKLQLLTIPLPAGVEEQRRISEILDKADALRAKRRAALAQLDSLIQSIFLDMFGNPATNPKGWPLTRLGDLCEDVIDCPHSTPIYSAERTPYPCVRSSDIQNGALDFRDAKYVDRSEYNSRIARGKPLRGDVIYCREGARFGNAARVVDDRLLCLGQRMMLFRPKSTAAVSEYIWAFLSSAAGYREAARSVDGSAAPHVNIREIVAFRLPAPPLGLQRDFACRNAAIDKLKDTQGVSLAELDALFASLQHRAFQGEL